MQKNYIILKILENTEIESFLRWHVKIQDYGREVGISLNEFHVTVLWRLGTDPD